MPVRQTIASWDPTENRKKKIATKKKKEGERIGISQIIMRRCMYRRIMAATGGRARKPLSPHLGCSPGGGIRQRERNLMALEI